MAQLEFLTGSTASQGVSRVFGSSVRRKCSQETSPNDHAHAIDIDQRRGALGAAGAVALSDCAHGDMQVGLMRARRGSPHLTSPCDRAHYGYFAAQPVWRYAASLAGSAAICRSAHW